MYQPRFRFVRSQDAVRGAQYPWVSFADAPTGPFGLAHDFPVQQQTPLHLVVLDNGMTRELHPRQINPDPPTRLIGQQNVQIIPSTPPRLIGQQNVQIIHEPPPRFIGQQNVQVSRQQDESRLTQDEQNRVLKQLKLQTYNPGPKKLARRVSLYYREKAKNIVNQREKEIDDDGKRCAICLEDFEPKELVMLTPCNHMFHEDCIVPWVKSHGQCPVCRFALCERMSGTSTAAPLNNNNFENVEFNDPYAGELISIIRAMEEAFLWGNRAR